MDEVYSEAGQVKQPVKDNSSTSSLTRDHNELSTLQENYAKLCNTMTDIENLLKYFVAERIITLDEEESIKATVTKADEVKKLLLNISGPLQAGNKDGFYVMLKIMKDHGTKATQSLAEDIGGAMTACCTELIEEQCKGNNALSSHLKLYYKNGSPITSTEDWLPLQPCKEFIPVVMVRQNAHTSLKDNVDMVSNTMKGNIDQYASKCGNPINKDLQGVISLLDEPSTVASRTILLEGSPGIGKTVLLKQITYLWATDKLLQDIDFLFLLHLRNPAVQEMKSLTDVVQYFYGYEGDTDEIAHFCTHHLLKHSGKSVAFLLDGYDEFPMELRKDSYIAKILDCKVLPARVVLISSRPHASKLLHDKVLRRVDVLGFSEEDRTEYIHQSLKGEEDRIKEITEYLNIHQFVYSACFVPFIMCVLMYLYIQGNLPRVSTGLYEQFVIFAITKHLEKLKIHLPEDIELYNIPHPYCGIIKQLCKFAFFALGENKLVFPKSEIQKFCPDIAQCPNGFGLLQAIEYPSRTRTTHSFNFIHLSVQEYLACYYFTHLPPNDQSSILKTKFWNDEYRNMFNMYTTLTSGQQDSFKQFLCNEDGTVAIDKQFLEDKLMCLCLYTCFLEVGDEQMCHVIEESFEYNRAIYLFEKALTPTELLYVITMVTKSSIKEWIQIELGGSGIQDFGLKLLHNSLIDSNVTIYALGLHNNGLTSASDGLVSDIAVSCQVNQMILNHNSSTFGESKQFKVLSHPSTCLQELVMSYNTYTTDAVAMQIFSSLLKNNSLETLVFFKNNMQATEKLSNMICKVLQLNTTLRYLSLDATSIITIETLPKLMNALKKNNTLATLILDKHLADGIGVMALQLNVVMNNRVQNLFDNGVIPFPVLCIKVGDNFSLIGSISIEESDDGLEIDCEVQTGPYFTTKPSSQAVDILQAAMFHCAAVAADADVKYQWTIGSGSFPSKATGINTKCLVIPDVRPCDDNTYTCTISNEFGTLTSDPVKLTVTGLPMVTVDPHSQSVEVTQPVKLTTTVSGVGKENFSYQWIHNGVDINGEIGSILTIPFATENSGGQYSCTVCNQYGDCDTSNESKLDLKPCFVVHPMDVTVNTNNSNSVQLACDAEGATKYEWVREGGAIRCDVEGKDTNCLVFNEVQQDDTGWYYCKASINGYNSVESRRAMVMINESYSKPDVLYMYDNDDTSAMDNND